MTQRAARSWPVVMTASPICTGPCSTASFSTASPPARLTAAATPWSIHSSVADGVTIGVHLEHGDVAAGEFELGLAH